MLFGRVLDGRRWAGSNRVGQSNASRRALRKSASWKNVTGSQRSRDFNFEPTYSIRNLADLHIQFDPA